MKSADRNGSNMAMTADTNIIGLANPFQTAKFGRR